MVSFENILFILFCILQSLFVWSLYVVKSTTDLFDDDEEGDLFKEKPAIPSVVAGTTKETESQREAIMEKKVMAYNWIIGFRKKFLVQLK